MAFASRGLPTALSTLVLGLALAGCGGSAGSGGGSAASTEPDAAGPVAAVGVTDGRTGPAVTATDSEAARELSRGGPSDPSDPRRSGGRREGIGAGDSCTEPELDPTAGNLGQIEATTLCLLNGVRADDGLRPLTLNGQLADAARAHSQDMVANSYFAHEGRNGSAVKDRIGATGYLPKHNTWTIGENLAWGTGALATPKAIVNAWMNSQGHRDNILKPEYREIGMGIVAGNPADTDGAGATYATEFGVRGETSQAVPVASKSAPRLSAAARRKALRARQARAKRARAARAKRASAKRAATARAAAPRP